MTGSHLSVAKEHMPNEAGGPGASLFLGPKGIALKKENPSAGQGAGGLAGGRVLFGVLMLCCQRG